MSIAKEFLQAGMYTCQVLGHPYPLIFLSVGSDLPGGARMIEQEHLWRKGVGTQMMNDAMW